MILAGSQMLAPKKFRSLTGNQVFHMPSRCMRDLLLGLFGRDLRRNLLDLDLDRSQRDATSPIGDRLGYRSRGRGHVEPQPVPGGRHADDPAA